MPTYKPKTAEAKFREAFQRLKAGTPRVLPTDAQVSQNNVAKEAGCDPTALRKARFPDLVQEIQTFLSTNGQSRPTSKRQSLLKARQASRSKAEIISNFKAQRDDAVSRLVEADDLISSLTLRVRDLEARLNDLQPSASVFSIKSSAKPRDDI